MHFVKNCVFHILQIIFDFLRHIFSSTGVFFVNRFFIYLSVGIFNPNLLELQSLFSLIFWSRNKNWTLSHDILVFVCYFSDITVPVIVWKLLI